MSGEHWLLTCSERFPEIAKRRYRNAQDLIRIEQDVRAIGSPKCITQGDLYCIETNPAWSYGDWWVPLSHLLEGCSIEISGDIRVRDSKQRLVKCLLEKLNNVRVASVLLRFKLPDEFAILSDPIIALLNLSPERSRTKSHSDLQVEFYMRYLDNLQSIRSHLIAQTRAHPGVSGNWVPRIADIDSALWCAAHLPETDMAAAAMRRDRFFQELQLNNLLDGLFAHRRRWTDAKRLLFASLIVQSDHAMAAAIAAPIYESLLGNLAKEAGLCLDDYKGSPGDDQINLGRLAHDLQKHPNLRHIANGPRSFNLFGMLEARHAAVHRIRSVIEPCQADWFVNEVNRLNTERVKWRRDQRR